MYGICFMSLAPEYISKWGVWSTIISILIFDIQPPCIFWSGLLFCALNICFCYSPRVGFAYFLVFVRCYGYFALSKPPSIFRVVYLHCRDVVFVESVIMLVEEMRLPSKYIPLFE